MPLSDAAQEAVYVFVDKNLMEIENIRKFIENIGGLKEPEIISEKMQQAISLLARTATLLADAEEISAIAHADAAVRYADYKAHVARHLIAADCKDILRCVRALERYNAVLTHGIDGLRSVLSYEKQLKQRME